MSTTMVGRRRKILKLRWLKGPKAVPIKQNLYEKINDLKSHIWSLSNNPLTPGVH